MSKKCEDLALAELVAQWQKQKNAEKRATAVRVETEKCILQRLEAIGEDLPAEGASTLEVQGGLKITVTNKLNRKITDADKLREIQGDIPENLRPWSFVETIKLEPAGLRWLYDNEPGLAALCAEFIEEKPAKAGFKVVEA